MGSIEHKTGESLKGSVDDEGIVKIEGMRVVGVQGPTFVHSFMGPMAGKRDEVATLLLAQLAVQVAAGEITIPRIMEMADEYVHELHRTLTPELIASYFQLYLDTDVDAMKVLEEKNGDFELS